MVTNRSSTITSFVKLRDTHGQTSNGLAHGADLQVCTNGCLVLVAKPLVHILIHERGLPDATEGSRQYISTMRLEKSLGWCSNGIRTRCLRG